MYYFLLHYYHQSVFGANPCTRQLPVTTGITFNLQLGDIYATVIIIKCIDGNSEIKKNSL